MIPAKRNWQRRHASAPAGLSPEVWDDYKLRSEAKMCAFDQLPKIVRRALTASQFNWNVEQLLAMYRQRRMSAWQLVDYIRREDRWRLEDRGI